MQADSLNLSKGDIAGGKIASVSGAIVLRSIMGPGAGAPGGVCAKLVQNGVHTDHTVRTHTIMINMSGPCVLNATNTATSTHDEGRAPTDGYMLMTLLRNQALTSPTPHEPPRGPR